jgi:hypothetical protein
MILPTVLGLLSLAFAAPTSLAPSNTSSCSSPAPDSNVCAHFLLPNSTISQTLTLDDAGCTEVLYPSLISGMVVFDCWCGLWRYVSSFILNLSWVGGDKGGVEAIGLTTTAHSRRRRAITGTTWSWIKSRRVRGRWMELREGGMGGSRTLVVLDCKCGDKASRREFFLTVMYLRSSGSPSQPVFGISHDIRPLSNYCHCAYASLQSTPPPPSSQTYGIRMQRYMFACRS